MNKDLKKEYEALLESEIPDLWSRIEPKLHDKSIDAPENETIDGSNEALIAEKAAVIVENTADVSKAPAAYEKEQPTENSGIPNIPEQGVNSRKRLKFNSRRLYLYSGIAAACLCLAIAIPVIVRNSKGKSSDQTKTTDDTAYNIAQAVPEASEQTDGAFWEEEAWDSAASDSADSDWDMDAAESDMSFNNGVVTEDMGNERAEESASADNELEEIDGNESDIASGEIREEASGIFTVSGEILDITVSEAYIVYELELQMLSLPEELPGAERLGIVQYPEEDGTLEPRMNRGQKVKLVIRYEEEAGTYELLEIQ